MVKFITLLIIAWLPCGCEIKKEDENDYFVETFRSVHMLKIISWKRINVALIPLTLLFTQYYQWGDTVLVYM